MLWLEPLKNKQSVSQIILQLACQNVACLLIQYHINLELYILSCSSTSIFLNSLFDLQILSLRIFHGIYTFQHIPMYLRSHIPKLGLWLVLEGIRRYNYAVVFALLTDRLEKSFRLVECIYTGYSYYCLGDHYLWLNQWHAERAVWGAMYYWFGKLEDMYGTWVFGSGGT